MGLPYAEVIGDPVTHSKSPLIHRFWLEKIGLEGEYRRTRVAAQDLSAYLEARHADRDWQGCNVTMPHKVAIAPQLDGLFEAAKVIGAVNLVVKVDGKLVGNNTDLRGFAEPFREDIAGRGTAALIGAGGAARAAFIALAALGFTTVHVGNRTRIHAEAMLRSLGQRASLVRSLEDGVPAVDLLVNASSLGSRAGDAELDLRWLPPTAIVYDIVYAPLETPLLAAARKRGLRTLDGLTMLIAQAAASFVHFFDAQPPREHDAELRELLTR
ncbi:MAG TPA: shikimate dehydrogenase [Allosphingosinicella sp.]